MKSSNLTLSFYVPQDDIIHSLGRENFKSYTGRLGARRLLLESTC
jgi:hypothetical protein